MTHDARHKLDNPISDLQAKLESDPVGQNKLWDVLQTLMDIREQDLQDMEPKARRMDVWKQRLENDTWDLY